MPMLFEEKNSTLDLFYILRRCRIILKAKINKKPSSALKGAIPAFGNIILATPFSRN